MSDELIARLRSGFHRAEMTILAGMSHDARSLAAADRIAALEAEAVKLRGDYDAAEELNDRLEAALAEVHSKAAMRQLLLDMERAKTAALDAQLTAVTAERDEAILAEKMRMMSWCAKRQAISRKAWERAARKALAGDMAELRNRIAMIDAGPMDIVLSDAALTHPSD